MNKAKKNPDEIMRVKFPQVVLNHPANMKIRKKTGELVAFNPANIFIAIEKANAAVAAKHPEAALTLEQLRDITDEVTAACIKVRGYPMVDKADGFPEPEMTIQDMVEQSLLARSYKVGKAYGEYRFSRMLARKANTTDESILSLLRNENKELAEENSNKDTMLASTQRDYIAGEVSRDLTRRILLPEHISKAHDDGAIHFHDADYFVQPIFNCCLINIGDMLDNGTVMNGKKIDSPHSFRVACTIVTQVIACVASNQYGGQSVDLRHLGKYLRISRDKFARKVNEACPALDDEQKAAMVDVLLKDELAAGIQTIQYQLNTLMTTNGQSPFVTLFLNLQEDDPYIEENAMIIEEVLGQRMEGIKNEKGVYITPAFPKLVYVLDEHNCLKGGKYDYLTELAVKCSAKRMYPDYISAKKMRENYQGNVFSPMGCRSFLAPWKDEDGNYKFEGRFNQGVVSLNLPQIGILANGDEEKFWDILNERLDICFEALMCRHNALKKVRSDSSPIHWQYGAIARLPKGASIEPLLYGGYSSISLGYIGLYEVTKLMTGVSHTQPTGGEFAMKVMNRLRKACDDWKAETNIGFALYGTPAESLCYRFARIDKERFGTIPDVTDKGYYTNSYHVDVREHIDAFDKFTFESQFQKISTGGCISYVEIPNMRHNLEALKDVVRSSTTTSSTPSSTPRATTARSAASTGRSCQRDFAVGVPLLPQQGPVKMNVTRRTCGYLGENFWNVGKTKEISSRVTHL